MADLNRDNAKFYDRIRQSLKQMNALYKPSSSRTTTTTTTQCSRDGAIFAKVTREQMEIILSAYEEHQNDKTKSNKPVVCDETIIKGGSYAAMLYADPNFHHIGSTDHLISELGIDDVTRSSLLGEYNTFPVSNSEDIDGLKKMYLKETIRKLIELVNKAMNENNMQLAKDLIERALKLYPRSGLAKTAKGKYHEVHREYEDAAREFREALDCEGIDKKDVNIHLSNVLYQLGMCMYYQRRWRQAESYFIGSLHADPDNQASRLHLNLTRDKIKAETNRGSAFRSNPPAYRK